MITSYGPKTLPRSKYYYHPHLIGEQTESQGGKNHSRARNDTQGYPLRRALHPGPQCPLHQGPGETGKPTEMLHFSGNPVNPVPTRASSWEPLPAPGAGTCTGLASIPALPVSEDLLRGLRHCPEVPHELQGLLGAPLPRCFGQQPLP